MSAKLNLARAGLYELQCWAELFGVEYDPSAKRDDLRITIRDFLKRKQYVVQL